MAIVNLYLSNFINKCSKLTAYSCCLRHILTNALRTRMKTKPNISDNIENVYGTF